MPSIATPAPKIAWFVPSARDSDQIADVAAAMRRTPSQIRRTETEHNWADRWRWLRRRGRQRSERIVGRGLWGWCIGLTLRDRPPTGVMRTFPPFCVVIGTREHRPRGFQIGMLCTSFKAAWIGRAFDRVVPQRDGTAESASIFSAAPTQPLHIRQAHSRLAVSLTLPVPPWRCISARGWRVKAAPCGRVVSDRPSLGLLPAIRVPLPVAADGQGQRPGSDLRPLPGLPAVTSWARAKRAARPGA